MSFIDFITLNRITSYHNHPTRLFDPLLDNGKHIFSQKSSNCKPIKFLYAEEAIVEVKLEGGLVRCLKQLV